MARYANLASVLALVALMLAAVCLGGKVPATSLEGSVEAKIEDFPSIVAIEMFSPESNQWLVACSGTLLDELHVLTAKSCLTNHASRKYRVKVGCQQLSECGDKHVHKIDKAIMNPCFEIAILSFSHPVTTHIQLMPIAKYNISDRAHFGRPVSVAGWGSGRFGAEGRHLSDKLRKIEAKLLGPQECLQRIEPFKTDMPIICITGKNASSIEKVQLHGPLFQLDDNRNQVQIGLFMNPNSRFSTFVFLDVTQSYHWILECIGRRENCRAKAIAML